MYVSHDVSYYSPLDGICYFCIFIIPWELYIHEDETREVLNCRSLM